MKWIYHFRKFYWVHSWIPWPICGPESLRPLFFTFPSKKVLIKLSKILFILFEALLVLEIFSFLYFFSVLKLDFFWGFLIILFENIIFPKEFLQCIGCISSYLEKLNCGLELVSGAHFLHILSMKNFRI